MALNGFDGNGNFLRTFPEGGWKGDATAGIKIRADRHDDHDQAITNALSNMICKDGQTTVLADIPFNGKKITGLGAPTLPTDAVNKSYADSVKTFTTGTEVSGADLNGRVTFTSPTGANGLAWTGADLSWIARLATAAGPSNVPPATLNRVVLNDKPDGSGTDVVTFNDNGNASVTGTFTATGQVLGGTVKSLGNVFAGAANMNTDGNIGGTIWAGWGAGDAFNAISARIEARGQAWANDRVSSMQYRRVGGGGWTSQPSTTFHVPAGCVMTGLRVSGGRVVDEIWWMALQVYDPVRGWVGFSG
jgi:hypothetical protein